MLKTWRVKKDKEHIFNFLRHAQILHNAPPATSIQSNANKVVCDGLIVEELAGSLLLDGRVGPMLCQKSYAKIHIYWGKALGLIRCF